MDLPKRHSEVRCGVEEVRPAYSGGSSSSSPCRESSKKAVRLLMSQPAPSWQASSPRQLAVRSCYLELDNPGPLRSHYPEHPEHASGVMAPALRGPPTRGLSTALPHHSAGFRRPVLTVLSVSQVIFHPQDIAPWLLRLEGGPGGGRDQKQIAA